MHGSRRGRRAFRPAPVRCRVVAFFLVSASLLAPSTLSAQRRAPGSDVGRWRGPVTPLPTDHWAYDALDRLAAAGWLEAGRVDGARPLPVAAVGAALEAAARAVLGEAFRDGSAGGSGGRARTATGAFAIEAWTRFRREFPSVDGPVTSTWLGYEERRDGDEPWHGTVLEARIHWMPVASVGMNYEPELRFAAEGGVAVDHGRFGVATRVGGLWLFAGRERLAFATGAGGGVTLSDAVALDGIGVGLAEPLVLPVLGPVHGIVYLSRMGGDAFGDAVGFGAMRVSLEPVPWLQLHLNRTLLFARRNRGMEMSARHVLLMLLGKHTAFEDQRASVGVLVTADVAGWPVQPYLEWGFEDTAGLDEDPGIVAGVFLPSIPFAPAMSLRYEYTAFGEHALFLPGADFQPRAWYRHTSGIRERYVDDAGTPIGHPLGGYGYEHRVQAGGWARDARLRVTVSAFHRLRKEGNILYEERPGTSLGATAGLELALPAAGMLTVDFETEHGAAGWASRNVRVGVRW